MSTSSSSHSPARPKDAPVRVGKGEKQQADIEKKLEKIYQDEDGVMPDLTSFEPLRVGRGKWIALMVCSIVLFVGAIGFFVMRMLDVRLPTFAGAPLQALTLEVEGPERVAVGDETTYFINYHNPSHDPIASAEIRANFPADFGITGAQPAPVGEGLVWRLGALPGDAKGSIKVKGIFRGSLGTVSAIQIVGTYRPASFNSDFEALGTKVVSYADSALRGRIDGPAKILPGDRVVVKYTLENAGSVEVEGGEARITMPAGFEFDATQTKVTIEGREARIAFPSLAVNASTTVGIVGTFASGASGEAHVVAEAGRVAESGTFTILQHSETSFAVIPGDLALKLIVNGEEGDETVAYGSRVNVGIVYENTSPEDLKHIKLRLRAEPVTSTKSSLVNWQKAVIPASGTRSGNEITWTEDGVSDFLQLPSHRNGSLNVAFDTLASASGTQDLAVRLVAEAEIQNVGNAEVRRVVRAPVAVLTYQTDARITNDVRYFSEEGAPIGSGPIPPIAGQPTTYHVSWSLDKRFHELTQISLTAPLPATVSWADHGAVTAGELKYDSSARTVSWNLNRMPQGVSHVEASFDLRLIPLDADIGRFTQIIGAAKGGYIDSATKKTFTVTLAPVDTSLPDDGAAKGKGVVRKVESAP